jgi:hypothetical protein
MSETLILEFHGVTADQYHEVNGYLGLDQATGAGDWPAGLVDHLGAAGEDGSVTVVEIWDSRQAQQEFMDSRLGAALGKAGLPEPSRAEWLTLLGHNHPGH